MVTLDLIFLARGHAVVAQVIETEFTSGAVSDIAGIHFPARFGGHLLLYTADGQTEEII